MCASRFLIQTNFMLVYDVVRGSQCIFDANVYIGKLFFLCVRVPKVNLARELTLGCLVATDAEAGIIGTMLRGIQVTHCHKLTSDISYVFIN